MSRSSGVHLARGGGDPSADPRGRMYGISIPRPPIRWRCSNDGGASDRPRTRYIWLPGVAVGW